MSLRGKPIVALVAVLTVAVTAVVVLLPAEAAGPTASGTTAVRERITGIGESVVIDHAIDGNVQLLGGSVMITAPVAGDVIAFGSDVTIEGDGRIEGDLFCLGGTIEGASAESVVGEMFAPASIVSALEGAPRGTRPVIAATDEPFSLVTMALKLSLLLVWMIVAVVVTLLQSRELRLSSIEVRVSPFYSFFLGLVAFTSFVVTAIVFSYLIPYVVGLLLLVVLGIFAVVTKVYGMVAIFHAVGVLIAGPRNRVDLDRRKVLRGDLAMVVVGLLILGAIRMIPIVGNVIWMTASLVGVGVALGTRFGRRDPAFLAWRPGDAVEQ